MRKCIFRPLSVQSLKTIGVDDAVSSLKESPILLIRLHFENLKEYERKCTLNTRVQKGIKNIVRQPRSLYRFINVEKNALESNVPARCVDT